jgi:FAD/FMN-containing dehydrogenase/Fe-S oxidoreductase
VNIHMPVHHRLAERLKANIAGDVMFDAFSRGRYATDASIYQITPIGVVAPKTAEDVEAAMSLAREEGVTILARGGGTSQSGQTVGHSLVLDFTKYMNRVIETDFDNRTAWVEPGIAMDDLNRQIKASGLWFPVDVSTSSRATIGGMTGNNSCGTRSIRYGIMRDNVSAIDAVLASGAKGRFTTLPVNFDRVNVADEIGELFRDLVALGDRGRQIIADAFPDVSRRVGGYLVDALAPDAGQPINMATLLCGSEGTLAVSQRIKIKLSDQPTNKALGVCHFPTFRSAMEAAQHIVKLGPVAVEVVDATLIRLARDIEMFRPVMEAHVNGKPDALLLVEFAEPDQDENLRRLQRLDELMGDLGHPNSVGKVSDRTQQAAIWGVRTAGLNIMMSMKSEGKPVSFIEDAAVPLEHLADYTERLTAVFEKHGTTGTWYAHASVGCLHVRPVLNLKLEHDAKTMRAIAEEAFAMVKEYKGAHSGEHGDGLVRSEFHETMYGRPVIDLFEEIKDRFDPESRLNPGKIVRAPRMNDRELFRYKPDYRASTHVPKFDWSDWPGGAAGFQGAVEMCNNNGACRKAVGGAMCPSYRVTRNERDLTRGRANSLRLALSGQLGADALTSDEMRETMKLCVGCKACKRECPTGVDMAKMKTEVLAAANAKHGPTMRDRIVAYLPKYARYARYFAPLLNLRNSSPALALIAEQWFGIAKTRPLPKWQSKPFDGTWFAPTSRAKAGGEARTVLLFGDTFNRYFEPDNLNAAVAVLRKLGYGVQVVGSDFGQPVCCGRTYLAAGMIDKARAEARRYIETVWPQGADIGTPIVGLEPSCLLSLRDEFKVMGLGDRADKIAGNSFLLEEFLHKEIADGRLEGPIGRLAKTVHVHTHCHQKAFGADGPVADVLRAVDGLEVKTIESSCCGMAGSFGYQVETQTESLAMGELTLFPAVRAAGDDDLIAADGFSCRHQITDGTGRAPTHVVQILKQALGA